MNTRRKATKSYNEPIGRTNYQVRISNWEILPAGRKNRKKLKRDMEDRHGIVKSRNQMSQKDSKKMNRIKYFKKFPELKKDERLDFETTQSATRKLYIQK